MLHNDLSDRMSYGTSPAHGFAPHVCGRRQKDTQLTEMTTVISMKLTKRFLTLALLANLSLGSTLASGIAMAANRGGKGKNPSRHGTVAKHNKIASELRDQLDSDSGSSLVKVILQLNGRPSGSRTAL